MSSILLTFCKSFAQNLKKNNKMHPLDVILFSWIIEMFLFIWINFVRISFFNGIEEDLLQPS